jgi:hypothetical protein
VRTWPLEPPHAPPQISRASRQQSACGAGAMLALSGPLIRSFDDHCARRQHA